MSFTQPLTDSPVLFGEILFDRFPDGREVLGGAPFNVAWHLRGFGLDPVMISRIGKDSRGEEIRRIMATWGMKTSHVEVDELYPTGCVIARIRSGEPEFLIEPHQAYDRIGSGVDHAHPDLDRAMVLYHGTLALRGDASWQTLRRIREGGNVPAFVDVNLRPPWWIPERTEWCLDNARWVKLNSGELAELTGMEAGGEVACVEAAMKLAASRSIECVIVTRGDQGAILVGADGLQARTDAVPVPEVVDTVGAGDGFSAVAILGLVQRWDPARILERAGCFAAEICRMRGATSADPALYRRHLEQWRKAGGE